MDDDAGATTLARQVEQALDPFRVALRSDGYEIAVTSISSELLELKIDALDGACEDCLVPEHVMAQMIAADLPSALRSVRIRIRYPGH